MRWPWSKAEDSPGTLGGRVADLEAGFRRLEAEWVDHYDRSRRLHDRLAKREARAAADEGPSPPESPPPNGAQVLTPFQREMQLRRGRVMPGGARRP